MHYMIFVPLLICFYTFVYELMLYMFKHVRQKIKFLNLNLNLNLMICHEMHIPVNIHKKFGGGRKLRV